MSRDDALAITLASSAVVQVVSLISSGLVIGRRSAATVSRVDLQTGDVLVVQVPSQLPPDNRKALIDSCRRAAPGAEVLLLEGGASAGVLRPGAA